MIISAIGILPRTELLGCPIRKEFSTGPFHVVFIQLTTEFPVAMKFNKCDVTATVMSLQQSRGPWEPADISNLVHF